MAGDSAERLTNNDLKTSNIGVQNSHSVQLDREPQKMGEGWVDHLGGHEGSGGSAVSADKAGGAELGVGRVGGGLVLGQDGVGAHKGEAIAADGQALQEWLCLAAEDESVVNLVCARRLLCPASVCTRRPVSGNELSGVSNKKQPVIMKNLLRMN